MSKLSRKKFFSGLAGGIIATPFLIKALSDDAYAQKSDTLQTTYEKKHIWKMVTTWPPNFPILGEACNLISKWVYEMSGGRLEIKVYGAGELVPALEVFDAVKDGAAELGNGCSYYWAGKIPAAQFFATVPFGMNAQQMNAWLTSGGGIKLWQELYADYNLVPFPVGNSGYQMGGWFNKEINTIDDFKGLKMRMPGLGGKVIEKAGASPVLIAGSEIYTSLERGIIDATEWLGPFHDYKMGFHQIAKYYYVNGWHEPGTNLEGLVNKEKFEELTPDLQAILKCAMLRANHWVLSECETQNSIFLQKIMEEENVKLRYYSKDILETMRSFSEEVIQDLIAKDAKSKKIYASYKKFAADAKQWAEISEKQYYQSIMS